MQKTSKSTARQSKKVNARGDVWCSFRKKYIPAKFFYKNASKPSGYACECIPASKAKWDYNKYKEIVSKMPKKEQRYFV